MTESLHHYRDRRCRADGARYHGPRGYYRGRHGAGGWRRGPGDEGGLNEVADVFVVNKADRDGANGIKAELELSVHLRPAGGWSPPVLMTQAAADKGVNRLVDAIAKHGEFAQLHIVLPYGLERPSVLVSFVPGNSSTYATSLSVGYANGSFSYAEESSSLPPTDPNVWKLLIQVSGDLPRKVSTAGVTTPSGKPYTKKISLTPKELLAIRSLDSILFIHTTSSGSPLLRHLAIDPGSFVGTFTTGDTNGGSESSNSLSNVSLGETGSPSPCWKAELVPEPEPMVTKGGKLVVRNSATSQFGEVYPCSASLLHPGHIQYQVETFIRFPVESIATGHVAGVLPGIIVQAWDDRRPEGYAVPYRVIVIDRYGGSLVNPGLSNISVSPTPVAPFLTWNTEGLLFAHWSWAIDSDLNQSQEIANICLVLVGVVSAALITLGGFLIKRLLVAKGVLIPDTDDGHD